MFSNRTTRPSLSQPVIPEVDLQDTFHTLGTWKVHVAIFFFHATHFHTSITLLTSGVLEFYPAC